MNPSYEQISEAIIRTWNRYILAHNHERAAQWSLAYLRLYGLRDSLYPNYETEEGE